MFFEGVCAFPGLKSIVTGYCLSEGKRVYLDGLGLRRLLDLLLFA